MPLRTMTALLAATALLLAPAADAAPKKKKVNRVCNLLKDAKGDATQFYVAGEGTAPNDPALDVVTADVASNGKVLETVLRVDKLARTGTTSPYGYTWYAYFTVGGTEFYTQAQSPPTGDAFTVGYTDTVRTSLTDQSGTKGVIDLAKNEIRVWFNLSQLAERGVTVKKGAKVSGIRFITNRLFARVVFQSDTGSADKTYIDSTPSCVTVGK